jgi:hypothetical protein
MKKELKQKLVEAKEIKKTMLIEEKVVETRIKSIFENESDIKYFNGLPKKKKLQYSLALIREIAEINKLEFINEQFDFMDILKSLFGRAFGGVIESAAEPLIGSILSKVGFKDDSYLKRTLISLLTSKPSDLIKAFGDCKVFTKIFVRALIEAYVMGLQKEFNADSMIYNTIRNTLGGVAEDTAIVSSIENKIQGAVCDMFSGFTDKAKDVVDKLKAQSGT